MDLNATQKIIVQFLRDITPQHASALQYQIVQDTQHHHYQLLVTGWQNNKRVHGIVVQIDLRDGLVWVQENGTDFDVAAELEQRGIAGDKIVIAYLNPINPQMPNVLM
jgi:XisI protein